MKVRMYIDVPEWAYPDWSFSATSKPYSSVMVGWKRIAFDVDMPPDVLKTHDAVAPAKVVGEVPGA